MNPSRNVTEVTQEPRFRLYALCPCEACNALGWVYAVERKRCTECRGEGKVRQVIAEAETPQAVGVALVTCAREGAWEGCQFGLLDTQATEIGKKWLILPWQASPTARNVSDAGRVLARSKNR